MINFIGGLIVGILLYKGLLAYRMDKVMGKMLQEVAKEYEEEGKEK